MANERVNVCKIALMQRRLLKVVRIDVRQLAGKSDFCSE